MLKKIIILLLVLVALPIYSQNICVATYNLRYANERDSIAGNAWSKRLPHVVNQIRTHGFDVFGAQEVTARQMQDLKQNLIAYEAVGVGRDDGKLGGEFSPVFFKKDRFVLLDFGTFWLSPTPEVPSKGWDAALPRICTWVFLKDKETHRRFYFFNTHLDHVGELARNESIALILEMMQGKRNPIIFTGDLNSEQCSAAYGLLEKSPMKDAFFEAEYRNTEEGTFNNFALYTTNSRIDHIFVTPQVAVQKYVVLKEFYFEKKNEKGVRSPNFPQNLFLYEADIRFPSDHYPVMAVVKLKER